MGGDPEASESFPVRRIAGVREGCRGQCRGDILGNCSYSRGDSRGCDGGGVGVHGGVPQLTIARVLFSCTTINRPFKLQCLYLVSVCSPKFVNRRNGG